MDTAKLATLTGSEKQVAWAETIRAQKIAAMEAALTDEWNVEMWTDMIVDGTQEIVCKGEPRINRYRKALALSTRIARAAWWIDNRAADADTLLSRLALILDDRARQVAK